MSAIETTNTPIIRLARQWPVFCPERPVLGQLTDFSRLDTVCRMKSLFKFMPACIQKLGQKARAERREIARQEFRTKFIPTKNAAPKQHRPA